MSVARVFHTQQVHYLRKTVTFADNGTEVHVGTLPSGALILKPQSGVYVNVAFNAGTSNVIDIGTNGGGSSATDDPDLYGTDMALGSIAFVALDEAVTMVVPDDTKITASVALAGTAATAGSAEVVIAYIPDNDG